MRARKILLVSEVLRAESCPLSFGRTIFLGILKKYQARHHLSFKTNRTAKVSQKSIFI